MIINIKNIRDDIQSDLRYLGGLPYPNNKIKNIIVREEEVLNRVLAILNKHLRDNKDS